MNFRDFKTYKYITISKSNFFMIIILSFHSICSESKKVIILINAFFFEGVGARHTIIIESFISNQRIYCTILGSISVTHNKCINAHFRHSLKIEKCTTDSSIIIQSLTTFKITLKRIKKCDLTKKIN